MNTVWIGAGLGVAAAIIAFITSWHRRNREADLGAVSYRWVAEQRHGQAHDPQR